MTGHTPWARARERRAESPGRHRKLPVITETPMPSSLAASLPLQATAPSPAQPPAPPEPDRIVVCGFCHVSGLSSQIPDIGGQVRCADIGACVQRSVKDGRPAPLPTGPEPGSSTSLTSANAESVPESRRSEGGPAEGIVAEPEPAEAEADAAQFAATEALARWGAKQTLSEDGGADEAAADAGPSVCPGDYLDGREDEGDELDLPLPAEPAPAAAEMAPEDEAAGGES